jgi:hypothetical protein
MNSVKDSCCPQPRYHTFSQISDKIESIHQLGGDFRAVKVINGILQDDSRFADRPDVVMYWVRRQDAADQTGWHDERCDVNNLLFDSEVIDQMS